MRLACVCSPYEGTPLETKWNCFFMIQLRTWPLLPSRRRARTLLAPPPISPRPHMVKCVNERDAVLLSLHRWQYPSAWSANWCWMIASWKLKPITRCYTGKGQCDSNLRGRVVPGTTKTKKKKKQKSFGKLIVESVLKMGNCPPITPYPSKFFQIVLVRNFHHIPGRTI